MKYIDNRLASGPGGSGDVVGPSSVDNTLPVFSGATGKLLKNAPVSGDVTALPATSSGAFVLGGTNFGSGKTSPRWLVWFSLRILTGLLRWEVPIGHLILAAATSRSAALPH